MVSKSSCRLSHWCTEVGRWGSLDYTHSSSSPPHSQGGSVEAHGHTRVMVALRPARPRLVITLWSPGDSLTACPHPCDGASGWTWPTLCGRCAQNKAPLHHWAPPENVPGLAGRLLAGCWGQRSKGSLCYHGPREHLRDPLTPQEACAWSAECHDLPPNARLHHRPGHSGSAVEGWQERRGRGWIMR